MSQIILRILPFLSWFKLITKESLKADLIAGITGAVIVLPQGVAFATIAGRPRLFQLLFFRWSVNTQSPVPWNLYNSP